MFVYTGKLVFKSYMPLKLEKGMYFIVKQNKEMVLTQLGYVPFNQDEYLQQNGYPVEPYIINPGNPNIANDGFVIAEPHQIGWWDVGEESDELYDITTKEINQILDNDGWVDVEIEEELYKERPVPILYYGKVILSDSNENDEYLVDDDDNDDNEDDIDDDEDYLCGTCNGSGEGMFDGSRCFTCKGSGVIKKDNYEY